MSEDGRLKSAAEVLRSAGVDPHQPTPEQIVKLACAVHEQRRRRHQRPKGSRVTEPIDLLLSKLEGVRRTAPGSYMARCPCHQDRTPSLSVREAADGRVLIYCFGGCGASDIVLAVGLDLADLFPPRQQTSYGPPRIRDNTIPRVPAADALKILDQESFCVVLVADALANGDDVAAHRDRLIQCSARICEVRRLWEMQP